MKNKNTIESLKSEEYGLMHVIFRLNRDLLLNSLKEEPIIKWDNIEESDIIKERNAIKNTINNFEAELAVVKVKIFLYEKPINNIVFFLLTNWLQNTRKCTR